MQQSTLKIGLVLSGGGIRGVAHLGVVQALYEYGVQFSHISGTSAGAIAGAFIAQGISPKEILNIVTQTNLFRLLRPSMSSLGLLSMIQSAALYRKHISHNSFSKLKIPLTIAVVDIGEAKIVYLNSGDLDKALLASSTIPGLFKPMEIEGHMYIDGGILNNFPVEPLIGQCDFIIGSACNHLPVITKVNSFRHLIERSSVLAISANMVTKRPLCQVLIEPQNLGTYGLFDTKSAEEIFWIGYEETLKTIDRNEALKAILPQKRIKKQKAKTP